VVLDGWCFGTLAVRWAAVLGVSAAEGKQPVGPFLSAAAGESREGDAAVELVGVAHRLGTLFVAS
jgi:hypothetical protein